MKLKNDVFDWVKYCQCPCCNNGKFEFINTNDTGILVNVESKGRVKIDNFWMPSLVCNNPCCKWSKIKTEVSIYNLTSAGDAWNILKEI